MNGMVINETKHIQSIHTRSLYKSVQSHKRCLARNEFTAIEAFGLCMCAGGERVQACVCERYIGPKRIKRRSIRKRKTTNKHKESAVNCISIHRASHAHQLRTTVNERRPTDWLCPFEANEAHRTSICDVLSQSIRFDKQTIALPSRT